MRNEFIKKQEIVKNAQFVTTCKVVVNYLYRDTCRRGNLVVYLGLFIHLFYLNLTRWYN